MSLPKVAVLGGGTGSFVVASGLRHHPVETTVILTMVDDGGSNKVLRDQFGLLPTSGIRQAIVALSENQTLLRQLFTYRFDKGGTGLEGMTFGNLFMAAMADITGSQQKGIEETCKLLQVKGRILPISYDDVRLVATYEDGTEVIGEHYIDEVAHDGTLRITKLETVPAARLNPEAREALLAADLIILGPGDFYTNTIANLVVAGLPEILAQTKAKVVFITNLMTKYGETYNYTLKDFTQDLAQYISLDSLDYVLINDNESFPAEALALYEAEHSIPIEDNLTWGDVGAGTQLVRANLLSTTIETAQKGDVLKRSILRHDPEKLVRQLMQLVD